MNLLQGKHTCEKCNTSNEWAYILPQDLSNKMQYATTFPSDKVHLNRNRQISETEYETSYRCPKCDCLNKIILTSDTYL